MRDRPLVVLAVCAAMAVLYWAQEVFIPIVLSILISDAVWVIWETLLAVPMLVAMKACCDHVDRLKPVGELLGK
ncbi:MAG: hypothetical protein HYY76_19885 [Acidobacteria bacterium]|nr:hypothetical protein [Acidobacteriota bacterium]